MAALEKAEAVRTRNRGRMTRRKVDEPVPEKRARSDSTPRQRHARGPSHEEPRQDNRANKTQPNASGNMVTVRVAERFRNTALKMEGIHPSGPPAAEDLSDSSLRYNWRKSNKKQRRSHIPLYKVKCSSTWPGTPRVSQGEL